MDTQMKSILEKSRFYLILINSWCVLRRLSKVYIKRIKLHDQKKKTKAIWDKKGILIKHLIILFLDLLTCKTVKESLCTLLPEKRVNVLCSMAGLIGSIINLFVPSEFEEVIAPDLYEINE